MKRRSLSKSVRFEVFKRDSFTCQYCGKTAPDVVLHVDHIKPVAMGGDNDILNLVTACESCNAGKSATPLDDMSAVKKAHRQSKLCNERRVQIEMIADWHSELANIDEDALDKLEQLWIKSVFGNQHMRLTEKARDELRAVIKSFGFDVACDGVCRAAARYRRKPAACDHDMARNESFWMIRKICGVLKQEKGDPGIARLFYIRGIARNRFNYMNEGVCISILKEARGCGVDVDLLEEAAVKCDSWTEFKSFVEFCIKEDSGNQEDFACGTHAQY